MARRSKKQESIQSPLVQRLLLLSAREQLAVLLRATRSLSNKERIDIFGAHGFHFFRRKATKIALNLIIKRFVGGFITTAIYIAALFICLLAFGMIESNPIVFLAVVVTLAAFFVGSVAANIIEFCREILPFIMTTTPKEERLRLVRTIDELEPAERVRVLQATSAHLFRRSSGDSVVASFFSGILVALIGGILTITVMLICLRLPLATASSVPLVAALVAFPSGYLLPGRIQDGLDAWLGKAKRGMGLRPR